jgi:hypothetical protein
VQCDDAEQRDVVLHVAAHVGVERARGDCNHAEPFSRPDGGRGGEIVVRSRARDDDLGRAFHESTAAPFVLVDDGHALAVGVERQLTKEAPALEHVLA